jgi:hypothetical protein
MVSDPLSSLFASSGELGCVMGYMGEKLRKYGRLNGMAMKEIECRHGLVYPN